MGCRRTRTEKHEGTGEVLRARPLQSKDRQGSRTSGPHTITAPAKDRLQPALGPSVKTEVAKHS